MKPVKFVAIAAGGMAVTSIVVWNATGPVASNVAMKRWLPAPGQ